jgi:predicted XRE-type DNA-binding protein
MKEALSNISPFNATEATNHLKLKSRMVTVNEWMDEKGMKQTQEIDIYHPCRIINK